MSFLRSLFFFFFLWNCSYTYQREEILESDRYWQEMESVPCNGLALALTKQGKLDQALTKWDLCKKEFPDEPAIRLNLIRLFYNLDEYEEIRKIGSELTTFPSLMQVILNHLQSSQRWEEKTILLDGISRSKGWEEFAWEAIADGAMETGNLSMAEEHYLLLIERKPFHEGALVGLSEIHLERRKYYQVLDYLSSIQKIPNRTKEFHYLGLKANLELGRYAEAIRYAEGGSDREKSRVPYLEAWRDALLLLKDNPDWMPLLPHFQRAKEQGLTTPESVFLPSPDLKRLRSSIRQGRQ